MTENSGTKSEVKTSIRVSDTINDEGGVGQPPNVGRRNFAKAGLAAPVLLSVVNRTAWAGPACAPSAFASAAFASSQPGEVPCEAVGCSPGFWMNHPCAWPNPDCVSDSILADKDDPCPAGETCYSKGNSKFVRDGTTFYDAFGCNPDGGNGDTTLQEVLEIEKGTQNINFHAAAAILNAKTGQPGYPLSVLEVKTIFCELITTGMYSGLPWSPDWQDYFDNYDCIDETKDPTCDLPNIIYPTSSVEELSGDSSPGRSGSAPGQNK
ncbi:MAG: hypothetical protein DRR06_15345 [Gammaproteobacteria bacterium]|nr:MAG: hypothetical protein DRR06_15345 [Gammaproteobacteria bacterium]